MKRIVDRNHATPGPGTKKDPKRAIVSRSSSGNHLFAVLTCGHQVRVTKGLSWEEGVGVRCKQCAS